jgi:hypothetical protein
VPHHTCPLYCIQVLCGSDISFALSFGQIWDCPRFPARLIVPPALVWGILFMRKLQNRLVGEGIEKKKRAKSTTYQRALCLSTCTAIVLNAALVHHTITAIMVCAVVELLCWALNFANLLWWSYEYRRNLDATFHSFLLSKRPNRARKKVSFIEKFKNHISVRKSYLTSELSPAEMEKLKLDQKMIKTRGKLTINMMLGTTASLTCALVYVVLSNPLWVRDDAAEEGARLTKCNRRIDISTLLIARTFILLLGAAALIMAWIQTIVMFLASRRRQNGGDVSSMRLCTRQWWKRFALRIHPLGNSSTLVQNVPPQSEQPLVELAFSQFARSSVQES